MVEQIIVKTEDLTIISTKDLLGLGLHSVSVYDEADNCVLHCSCDNFVDNVQELLELSKWVNKNDK